MESLTNMESRWKSIASGGCCHFLLTRQSRLQIQSMGINKGSSCVCVCVFQMSSLCVCLFVYTKFDVALYGEQNVSCLQVSVDDVVLMKVTQSLQCLETHLTNLLLWEAMLQLYTHTHTHTHACTCTHTHPCISAFRKGRAFRGSLRSGHTYLTWCHPALHQDKTQWWSAHRKHTW